MSGNIIAPTAVLVATTPSATGLASTFGQVTTSATTATVVRKTTYTEPAAAAQRSVSSSSAADTAAGTGARQVKITYFDGSMNGPFTETVTLSGVAAVDTVAVNIRFIEKVEVVSVGSGGVNAGTITLFGAAAGGGGTVGTIAIGDNTTLWCHHYVANGKTCYLNQTLFGTSKAAGNFFVRMQNPLVATQPDTQATATVSIDNTASSQPFIYPVPLSFVGPMRLTAFAQSSSGASNDHFGGLNYFEQ